MLLGGDEIGRTQHGNNNAYCQDGPISWFNWDVGETGEELCQFVRDVIAVVRSNPILRRRAFFTGRPYAGMQSKDVTWIRTDGCEMRDEDWAEPNLHSIGMLLQGGAADEVDVRGRRYTGDSLLVFLNAGTRSRVCTLPRMDLAGLWVEELNTAHSAPWGRIVRTDAVSLNAHSTLLLRHSERNIV
jgi:glycogen operon protein